MQEKTGERERKRRVIYFLFPRKSLLLVVVSAAPFYIQPYLVNAVSNKRPFLIQESYERDQAVYDFSSMTFSVVYHTSCRESHPVVAAIERCLCSVTVVTVVASSNLSLFFQNCLFDEKYFTENSH